MTWGVAFREPMPPARLARSLELQLGAEALHIPEDRGDRHRAAVLAIAHQPVPGADVADGLGAVPAFGVADVVDRHIVVPAPEERRLLVSLARSEHVHRRGLALPLGDHPMLDAHGRSA